MDAGSGLDAGSDVGSDRGAGVAEGTASPAPPMSAERLAVTGAPAPTTGSLAVGSPTVHYEPRARRTRVPPRSPSRMVGDGMRWAVVSSL